MITLEIKVLILFFLLIILIGGGLGVAFCCYKLYKKIQGNVATISSMYGTLEYLEQKLDQVTDYYNFDTKYAEDTFNYFAVGNSLTLITSWGRGICSTKPDNDYFHLVCSWLESDEAKKINPNSKRVVAYSYNFSPWERSNIRNSTNDLLDVYLSNKLDLVTIQLGENCGQNTDTLDIDMEELINYVRSKAPSAEIVIIGDFWDKNRNEKRKKAAVESGASFADLNNIIGDSNYQSREGIECLLEDGNTIKVSANASTHPGDKGMAYIAEKVEDAITEGISNQRKLNSIYSVDSE